MVKVGGVAWLLPAPVGAQPWCLTNDRAESAIPPPDYPGPRPVPSKGRTHRPDQLLSLQPLLVFGTNTSPPSDSPALCLWHSRPSVLVESRERGPGEARWQQTPERPEPPAPPKGGEAGKQWGMPLSFWVPGGLTGSGGIGAAG